MASYASVKTGGPTNTVASADTGYAATTSVSTDTVAPFTWAYRLPGSRMVDDQHVVVTPTLKTTLKTQTPRL